MIPHYQIPRNTLVWLFVTQLLVLLPHIRNTPVWVSVLLLGCVVWRIQVFRGRWSFPNRIVKITLTLACCVGLVMSFPSFFGLEALVSVLFAGYGLKWLEMYRKRDALVLVYLSFFLIMTGFLSDQNILMALFNLLVMIVVITGWMGLYQADEYRYPWRSLRRSTFIVLQALPLMVVMFVLLPRFPSFWNIPLQKNTPKTGMSDSMAPGDFSRLTQNNEIVMRVSFDGENLSSRDLYWRGLVFSHFDGRRWQPEETLFRKPRNYVTAVKLADNRRDFLDQIKHFGLAEEGKSIRYDVILEETQTPWLYALERSIPLTSNIWVNHDQLLAKDGYVNSRFRYQLASYPEAIYPETLPNWMRLGYLQLPDGFNPRSRQRAQEWMQQSASPQAYADKLMEWFHTDFYYSLEPPALGEHSVDEFLFETRKGFCEHFASSFVFMLRAAGIPARVVVGYQGGEFNPYEKYWVIRQYDAHAWAEVWFAGQGWVRYDPTFAVAPQRILDGFRNAFTDSENLPLLSLDSYRNSPLLNALRLQWDRINYNWTRWVLSYDTNRQLGLLTELFGEYSVMRIGLFLMGFFAVFLLLVYGLLLWQERDRSIDPVLKRYRRLCRQLKRAGYAPTTGETPQIFLVRLVVTHPDRFAHLAQASALLYRYWYQGDGYQSDGDKQSMLVDIRRQLHT